MYSIFNNSIKDHLIKRLTIYLECSRAFTALWTWTLKHKTQKGWYNAIPFFWYYWEL